MSWVQRGEPEGLMVTTRLCGDNQGDSHVREFASLPDRAEEHG
jgi:hypothetical protein